ncbi:MAG: HPr family phosphocarrier protein [Spirochaetaceae bacterium]|nr:HPr family phosphocarrier protein [Spirochaetaceae bacterium]
MIEKTMTVKNRAGIHARPSALLVHTIKDFNCSVYLEKDGDRINAKSIMGVLTLAATYGTELKLIADGEDEEAAIEALINLFESGFQGD